MIRFAAHPEDHRCLRALDRLALLPHRRDRDEPTLLTTSLRAGPRRSSSTSWWPNLRVSGSTSVLRPARDPKFAADVGYKDGAFLGWRSVNWWIVTFGCGLHQRWGGSIEEIRPGDVVAVGPNEKYWHSATKATTHIALQDAMARPSSGSRRLPTRNTKGDLGDRVRLYGRHPRIRPADGSGGRGRDVSPAGGVASESGRTCTWRLDPCSTMTSRLAPEPQTRLWIDTTPVG